MQGLMAIALKPIWMQSFVGRLGQKQSWLFSIPARRFIAGDTIEKALTNRALRRMLNQLNAKPIFAYEVESAFDQETAESNLEKFKHCLTTLGGLGDGYVSIKLSSLAFFEKDPELHGYSEPQNEKMKDYLHQLLSYAVVRKIQICIDMECFIYKDPTFRIFVELLEAAPVYADHLQLAFQCYLKDSWQDAQELVAWAKKFNRDTGKRIQLRVVKGANLVTDRHHAQLGLHKQAMKTWHNQPRSALNCIPVKDRWFSADTPIAKDKETTQRQFIKIMQLFESGTDCISPVYGTMNPDTIAHIINTWRVNNRDPNERKIQTLLGMDDSLKFALTGMMNQQIYIPYAPLDKIIAYMIRRFIELKDSQKGAMPIMEYHDGKLVQIN